MSRGSRANEARPATAAEYRLGSSAGPRRHQEALHASDLMAALTGIRLRVFENAELSLRSDLGFP